jgi:hypothetical protein
MINSLMALWLFERFSLSSPPRARSSSGPGC